MRFEPDGGFSSLFIRRAVATTLVMAGITIFGVVAYRALPVSDLPNIEMPTLVVTANLPGANPETMSSAIATPLERQFSTIEGLDSMNSVNSLGSTSITLQFALSRDIDAAAQDVQTAITQAAPLLPAGMPTPPSFRRVNPADQPVIYLAIRSNTLPLYKVHEYADRLLAQRFSMLKGVAQVQIQGAQKYAVRVQVNPSRLAALGIGIDEVETAIRRHNVNIPTGTLYGDDRMMTIQASGQLTSAESYANIVVAQRNGAPVRLEEIAKVLDSVEDDKSFAWLSTADVTERFMNVTVFKQPGTNAVEVANAVHALLPRIRSELPPAVSVQVIAERANSIRESFEEVQWTMALTLGLVVMVIFLFLRNVSATVIPSLALPVSIIGTFAVMYLCGYSLNNLSMLALILAVGFVVDDAIVVLENIVRHMEAGLPPFRAAVEGTREVMFTIVSMTLSLAAVFIPLLFMDGILGRLFREFAVTIVVSIIVSGFVSVTLTPMLSARFLRTSHGTSRFYTATEWVFDALQRIYDRSLKFTLRHSFPVLMLSFLILGATVWLFIVVPKGFVPSEDRNEISTMLEFPQGTSHLDIARDMRKLSDTVRGDTAVESYSTSVGGSNGSANFGRIFFDLRPRSERPGKPGVDEVMARLRPKLNSLVSARAFLQNPPAIRIGGALSKSLYQYTLQSTDTGELHRGAQAFEKELLKIPGLTDVTSDLQIKNPQVHVAIDRDKAAALRVTPELIENALFAAYGPRWVSTIYAPDNQYRVLLEVDRAYQSDQSQMTALHVRSLDGQLVPLESAVRLEPRAGPTTINHYGQLPAVTMSFNLLPGVSLGEAVERIQELSSRILPDNISTTFQGTAQAFQQSSRNLMLLLFVAILVVYIVLGILYESFVHPLTILSGLPSAGFGALLTLWLFGLDLNIYSFVGLILLIGIVKKNAIMQIDFALDAERRHGYTPRQAIYQGCLVRFRPIMMTTMAALLGALPVALGHGAGGEARRPLGLCVVGGLLTSQLITLYLTPVVYLYLSRFQTRTASGSEYAHNSGPVLAASTD
ncbi:MAG: efflux RND transporter permease subunit [Acidobacteria bacterium]|nr:efflux RND transporter permease subunit [Acidobacteriota bacterium]